MRLLFAGTPAFAARALQSLLAAGHQVRLVLTQPDRPAGRGLVLKPSPVKELAVAAGITVLQPFTLKDQALQLRLAEFDCEAMVVAAYGLIVPQWILEMPRFGCINIHASLLPRWRGAAPIQRAILDGDRETGISIMQMDCGLDTGPLLATESIPIREQDSALTLHDALARLGARMIVEVLAQLPLVPRPQPAAGVTYAAKIEKAEAFLDWQSSASRLALQVRAFNPSPGATCCLNGRHFKVWQARVEEGNGLPGTILSVDPSGVLVACGEAALRLQEVQRPGGRRQSGVEFAAGAHLLRAAGTHPPDA